MNLGGMVSFTGAEEEIQLGSVFGGAPSTSGRNPLDDDDDDSDSYYDDDDYGDFPFDDNDEEDVADIQGGITPDVPQVVDDDEEDSQQNLRDWNCLKSGFVSKAQQRAHHNALERKRRDHIKESFEVLQESIPSLQGERSCSRSLVLMKSTEYIQQMRQKNAGNQQLVEQLRRECAQLQKEVETLEQKQMEERSKVAPPAQQQLAKQPLTAPQILQRKSVPAPPLVISSSRFRPPPVPSPTTMAQATVVNAPHEEGDTENGNRKTSKRIRLSSRF